MGAGWGRDKALAVDEFANRLVRCLGTVIE